MKAEPVMNERYAFDDRSFAEVVIWRLPRLLPVRRTGSSIVSPSSSMAYAFCATTTKRVRATTVISAAGKSPMPSRRLISCLRISGGTFRNGEAHMKTVTFEVSSFADVERRARAAFKGKKQGARVSFATPQLMFRVMTAKRWDIIRVMAGAGPMTLRALARRLDRDVKSVHGDAQALLKTGVLQKTEDGKLLFPYDAVHVDFVVSAA